MLKLKPDARILIVRLTAIGDAVHALPIACACARHCPRRTWPGSSKGARPTFSRGTRRSTK